MLQLIQNMKSGEMIIEEVPMPVLSDNMVLVRNHCSIISAGTEKTKIDLAKKNLLQKALARPDLVKQVWKKVKTEGLLKTYQTVNTRLESPSPLGYSCAGIVEETGVYVDGIMPGDRVACGGANYANHSEYVVVPKNLVVKIPDAVSLEEAAFTTIGAIALQGVRLAQPLMGETFLVLGLGLIGQITVQLLLANGCQVIGYDPDPAKQKLAQEFGAVIAKTSEDIKAISENLTHQHGVDGTIICAGTASNQPIETAGDITRSKGRVVIVGAVGMTIPREPYFKKEINLVVSRSYGPGRYDSVYEENGHDYPYDYVRFTEKRNMESFLQLVAQKRIHLNKLITHRYAFSQAIEAYQLLNGDNKEHYLGIVLNYSEQKIQQHSVMHSLPLTHKAGVINISCIGSGNYATASLLPILKNNSKVHFQAVMTASGRTAESVLKKYGFMASASQVEQVLDSATDLVMILTRHNTHAELTAKALAAGKHVYVEKPLAITLDQFREVRQALVNNTNSHFLIGFNRRFSPLTQRVKDFFTVSNSPKVINIRVNAGVIPIEHWTQDASVGGGRIVGEVCHFVDLASAIVDSQPTYVYASASANNKALILQDNVAINIQFANDSIANIIYTANGASSMAKEYIEVFSDGKSAVIHDFKMVELYDVKGKKVIKLKKQDKGQQVMLNAFIKSIADEQPLISRETLLNSSLATLLIIESLATGQRMPIVLDGVV